MYSGTTPTDPVDPTLLALRRRRALVDKYPFLQTTQRPAVHAALDDYAEGEGTEEEVINGIMFGLDRELTRVKDFVIRERTQGPQPVEHRLTTTPLAGESLDAHIDRTFALAGELHRADAAYQHAQDELPHPFRRGMVVAAPAASFDEDRSQTPTNPYLVTVAVARAEEVETIHFDLQARVHRRTWKPEQLTLQKE